MRIQVLHPTHEAAQKLPANIVIQKPETILTFKTSKISKLFSALFRTQKLSTCNWSSLELVKLLKLMPNGIDCFSLQALITEPASQIVYL
jgi:hypothetical protein